jgi:hypothetical protein
MCHSSESAECFFSEKVPTVIQVEAPVVSLASQGSMGNMDDAAAPDVDGTPNQPRHSVAVQLPHRASADNATRPRRFVDACREGTQGNIDAQHFVDLQDLSSDAMLLTKEQYCSETEAVDHDAAALEVVRILTAAGLVNGVHKDRQILEHSFPESISQRQWDAEWQQLKAMSKMELAHIEAQGYKHRSCTTARSRWLKANSRGSQLMNHLVTSARSLMARY